VVSHPLQAISNLLLDSLNLPIAVIPARHLNPLIVVIPARHLNHLIAVIPARHLNPPIVVIPARHLNPLASHNPTRVILRLLLLFLATIQAVTINRTTPFLPLPVEVVSICRRHLIDRNSTVAILLIRNKNFFFFFLNISNNY
jgi:hypothetical protein